MTIDEYLDQMRKARRRINQLYDRLTEEESKLLHLGNGIRVHRSRNNPTDNITEINRLNYIDLSNELDAVNKLYYDSKKSIEKALDYMLYREGCLIHHVYIYNVVFNEDDLIKGADEIVRTKNRSETLEKLNIAKEHLADILRKQGVDID